MSCKRLTKVLLGIAAAGAIAIAGAAWAGDEALEKSMDQALEDSQSLLADLVNADYEAALPRVDSILAHASRVIDKAPASAKQKEDGYLSYAYNLRENTRLLKTMLATLLAQEKGETGQGQHPSEYLPVVAATHFGGMMNMCVACHTRFRAEAGH